MPPKISVNRFSRSKFPATSTSAPTSAPNYAPVDVDAMMTRTTSLYNQSKKLVKTNEPVYEEEDEDVREPKVSFYTNNNDEEEDDFADLTNTKFVSKSVIEKNEKERKAAEKEREKEEKKQQQQIKQQERSAAAAEKAAERAEKKAAKAVDDDLFSTKGTELYGRDKLELMSKIQQYKVLFSDNKKIAAMKVKKNASVDELQAYVAECDAIIDTDCVETFITESILQTISMAEFASTRTKYNIKGLSKMLRESPQFSKLCKQLYVKYKVFGSVPPEAQMGLLIMSSTWVCLEKNKKESHNQSTLNSTIDTSDL